MKKLAVRIIAYFLILAVLDLCFCAAVDPYNVMHTRNIRDNGVEPNKNYVKMSYILDNPDRFDSFIFGSSKVGMIHVEKIDYERCYNMTYSMGLPKEHLDNIRTLISAGIVPERIYIGVDVLSYTTSPDSHQESGLRASYEYLKSNIPAFLKLYFDPAMVTDAIFSEIIWNKPDPGFADRFYRYGWNEDYGRKTFYDFDNAEPTFPNTEIYLDETIDDIRKIAGLCRENGVELIVFTHPMYTVTYQAALECGYLEFLEKLAAVTPYYNFSGHNEFNDDRSNFLDVNHFTAEAGDVLINCMCYGQRYDDLYEKGFGMYVTEENAGDLIRILKANPLP